MAFIQINRPTITVKDLDTLLIAWRAHGREKMSPVFDVTDCPLTGAQLRKLPRELKRRLIQHDSGEQIDIEELERLFRLPDPRD